MNKQEVEELLYLCGDERRLFWYFKDRYCLDLIAIDAERRGLNELSVQALKQSQCKQFVNKPIFNQISKRFPNGVVRTCDFPLYYPDDQIPFVVTLDRWNGDRYSQTTRKQSNLVLQLNFDSQHVAKYNALIQPINHCDPFEYFGHPVSYKKNKTLAWIRMDVDFTTDEVIIEEVQTDWIRKARRLLDSVEQRKQKRLPVLSRYDRYRIAGSEEQIKQYVAVELKPYEAVWNEAALMAVIQFIRNELGISSVYYHSFEQGNLLKNIYGAPPKSLYTTLPKKFGFKQVSHHPKMLVDEKKTKRLVRSIHSPNWYYLAV